VFYIAFLVETLLFCTNSQVYQVSCLLFRIVAYYITPVITGTPTNDTTQTLFR